MNVTVFFGREGWRASTLDPSGANLPAEHGPWTPYGPCLASDPEELADLSVRAFHLARRREDDDS